MDEFLYRLDPWARTLVAHNWPIIIYAVAGLAVAAYAFMRPSRRALLLLYGVGLLALAFEYEKHGTSPVQETLDYLFSFERARDWAEVSIWIMVDVLPGILQLAGVACVTASVLPFSWIARGSRAAPPPAEMRAPGS